MLTPVSSYINCLIVNKGLMGKVGSNRMIFPNVLDMVITNTVLLVSPLTF